MAKIEIAGTIEKYFPSGKGFTVLEVRKDQNGKEWKNWFNVWTDSTEFAVGSVVYVSGIPAASAYTAQDGTLKASIGINFPKISASSLEPVTPKQPAQSRSEDWGAPF